MPRSSPSTIAVHRELEMADGESGEAIVAELRRRGYRLIDVAQGSVSPDDVDLHLVLWSQGRSEQLSRNPQHAPVVFVGPSIAGVPCDATVVIGRALATVDAEKAADEVLSWKRLPWDTHFFSRSIGTVTRRRITRKLASFIEADCERAGIECLYYLADCHDQESVIAAEAHGFTFVDIRLTFETDLDAVQPHSDFGHVRLSVPTDIDRLSAIAGNSYAVSRYYFDKHFPEAICKRFYSEWLEKSCRGYASAVLVATDQNEPMGYVTCQIRDNATGAIELVGVSEQARGRSFGKALVQAALDWFRSQGMRRATVVTQGRNHGAQRLYQRCGFVTAETALWYHRWFLSADE
ncbi:MAG: GNAT family N-acetyltransferase [Acidobacteria bacterium]|nr:GNAT family N-acetyltransferase [Acidobacteriota bacterium]